MKNKLILDTIGLILIIAIFCILVCCVSVPFQPTIPEQGDVNADGCINNHDVLLSRPASHSRSVFVSYTTLVAYAMSVPSRPVTLDSE